MCFGVLRVQAAEFWPDGCNSVRCQGNFKLSSVVLKLSGRCRDLLLLFLVVNPSKVCPVTERTLLHAVFSNHAVLSSFCITPGSQTPKRPWRHAAKGNASFGKNTQRELDAIKAKKMVSKVKSWNGNLEGLMTTGAFCFCACSAGHVTIEVNELSDTQEKEESKKSDGPGKFQNSNYLIIISIITVMIYFYLTLLSVEKRNVCFVILVSK